MTDQSLKPWASIFREDIKYLCPHCDEIIFDTRDQLKHHACPKQVYSKPVNDLHWAKSMIQHYLKCGYLPEFSAMEAKAFLGKDKDWPNPYDRIRKLESHRKRKVT